MKSSRSKAPEYEGWCRRVKIRGIRITKTKMLHYYRRGHLLCGRHQDVIDNNNNGTPPGRECWSFSNVPCPKLGEPHCKECQEALRALRVLESLTTDKAET